MTTAAKKTAPAAKKTTPPAVVPQTPVATTAADFSGDAGSGFEGAGRDDMAIPFISILQGLSPEVKRSEGAYIDGAQEGMVLNTVTKQVTDTSKIEMIVIPAAYHRAFVEWRVREKGGGFVAEHPADTVLQTKTTRDDRGRDMLPTGNQLNDTRTFYVMCLDPDTGAAIPAVISMTSTQIRKAKQWMMQQNLLKLNAGGKAYTPPMFASKWRVETVPESNEKGSWFGWKFTHAGYLAGPSDPLFQIAKEFHLSVKAGETKADLAKTAPEPRIDPDTGEPTGAAPGDDDIPF